MPAENNTITLAQIRAIRLLLGFPFAKRLINHLSPEAPRHAPSLETLPGGNSSAVPLAIPSTALDDHMRLQVSYEVFACVLSGILEGEVRAEEIPSAVRRAEAQVEARWAETQELSIYRNDIE